MPLYLYRAELAKQLPKKMHIVSKSITQRNVNQESLNLDKKVCEMN